MKKTAIVFTHSHWDIEWYMPYRSFRFWLTELMDGLMDLADKDPRFHTFMLDGQVSPVEHYIAINPQNEQKIRKLIQDGKLTIGPFYTQFDEWLISGESMIRNTLHGILKGREFGQTMKAGYLPDNFGHPLQMPQILMGFGLDSLIFMRGMADLPEGMGDEFYLKGLDGTCILGIHMRESYANSFNVWPREGDHMTIRTAPYNEMFSGYESQKERIAQLDVEATAHEIVMSALNTAQRHPSGVLPMAAGCDHCPPISLISDILERANTLQDEIQFIQGDCQDIVETIKQSGMDFPIYDKELWGSRYQFLLSGTLSTRTYIKQANFTAENLLTQYAEPVSSIASMYGKAYPSLLLNEAWGEMYLNQAHDSIHGSSVDSVHREMMQRYDNVKQISVGILHDALKYLGTLSDPWHQKHRFGILAFHPPVSGYEKAYADVWIFSKDDAFHLEDKNGNTIPMQILHNPYALQANQGKTSTPAWPNAHAKHILIEVSEGSNTLHSLAVVDGKQELVHNICSETSMENDILQIEYVNGALNLLDKLNNRLYRNFLIIEEDADDGDAWDYSEPWNPGTVYQNTQFPSKCQLIENGPVRSTLRVETMMRVPRTLENGKRSRHKVELPLTIRVSLYKDAGRVEVTLELDNQAKNHRLRLKCPTGILGAAIKSQGHFGIIERPLRNPFEGKDWFQPPAETFHFRDWVAVDDGDYGLAIACRGLNEYEAIGAEDGTSLYVTLLRGMDRMSKIGMKSRKGEASASIPIPEAQCLGVQQFEFAFIPFGVAKDVAQESPFIGSANAFLYPPIAHVIREEQSTMIKDIEKPLFKLTPANLAVSAFKLSEDGSGHILRFWENEGKRTEGWLTLGDPSIRVYKTDLKEENPEELEITEDGIRLQVEPYKIVTLKLETIIQ